MASLIKSEYSSEDQVEREIAALVEEFDSILGQQAIGQVMESPKQIKEAALSDVVLEKGSIEQSETEKMKVRAEKFLQQEHSGFAIFAKDSSLGYEVSADSSTFSFNAKTNTVRLPIEWFDGRFSTEQLRFVSFHELSHFLDMRQNPEAFLENFAQMERDAKQIAARLDNKSVPRQQLEKVLHKELHLLYNCLDDIYVNGAVAVRAPYFRSATGAARIQALYREESFPISDFSDQPKHRQLAYSLLRDAMLPEEPSKVSDEVTEVITRKRFGRSIKDIVESNIKLKNNVLVDPAKRYELIRAFIQPQYVELLLQGMEKAIEEYEQGQGQGQGQSQGQGKRGRGESGIGKGKGGEGAGAGKGEFSPFGNYKESSSEQGASRPRSLGDLSREELEEIIKALKEAKRIKEMTPEEYQKYREEIAKRQFDQQHEIKPEQRRRFEAISTSIDRYRQEMRQFWQSLIGKSMDYEMVLTHQNRRGRLNVADLIDQFPNLQESQVTGARYEPHIYDRISEEISLQHKPERIDVSFVIDCSSSMRGAGETAAQKAAALTMLSLKDFNLALFRANQRQELRTKLQAYSEVYLFGDNFTKVKDFERGLSFDQSEADVIKSVSAINSDMGDTEDAAPLEHILKRLTPQEQANMKSGKLLKIVFMITDGEPNNAAVSAKAVRDLRASGVLPFAFQIGDSSDSPDSAFNQVWNNPGVSRRPLGVFVGEDFSRLPSGLIKTLQEVMKDIRL